MKKILILGAGTAGTTILNKLSKTLNRDEWSLTIVDKCENHYYQPGFLFIPFGIYKEKDVYKPISQFIPKCAEVVKAGIERIDPVNNSVILSNGKVLSYDFLIVATGCKIKPEETEGMKGPLWYKEIFDYYTLEGSTALGAYLEKWNGGRLIINITEMPIKCPVAPLEFCFLADWYFTKRGIRDKVDIHFVTPLPGAFTKPRATVLFSDFLSKKNIKVTTEFSISKVDNDTKEIVSWDERRIPFDLLVTIPTNMGDDSIERTGMGDELNFIPTDKETLRSKEYENIFVIGDATDLPTSKAGSVAHFQCEILLKNFLLKSENKEESHKFDGHANCFIETGFGRAILIDFNYDTEPLPGIYPFPYAGPLSLLKNTRLNHWSKLAFKWIYWNILLKGKYIPIEPNMPMAGKKP